MAKVVIYFEGGGDRAEGKAKMRRGLTDFLGRVVDRRRLKVIACGAEAIRDYLSGRGADADDRRLLLVDSEGSVQGSPGEHVSRLGGAAVGPQPDDDCHLMVQCMEAWLIVDIATLSAHFGPGFGDARLPKHTIIEDAAKRQVLEGLDAAVRAIDRERSYHKINDGATLLGRIDPDLVRRRAPHCDRLLNELTTQAT